MQRDHSSAATKTSKLHSPLCVKNQWFEEFSTKRLLDGNALSLLFWRYLWERDLQDAVLHLGLDIFGLTLCVSTHGREKTRRRC